MNKYISVDELFKCETCYHRGSDGKCNPTIWCDAGESYRPAIDKFKIIDGKELKYGHVIEHKGFEDDYYCECSECGTHEVSLYDKYCSECGVKFKNY